MLLANARLVDGTGRAPVERAIVRIEDGQITDVRPDGGPVPDCALDLEGRTLFPGPTVSRSFPRRPSESRRCWATVTGSRSLGELAPAMAEVTLERVAACAVLAGCGPQADESR